MNPTASEAREGWIEPTDAATDGGRATSMPAEEASSARGRQRALDLGRFHPFARGVRPWHFVLLPAAAMAVVILLFRALDTLILPQLGPVGTDAYTLLRPIGIGIPMASLIAWLAFRHRREYEAKLGSRQRALEDTRDFLSRVIEGSGEAIVTLDTRGHVTSWNPAAEAIYGWSAREMLGGRTDRLMPPGDATVEERRRIEMLLRAGETLRDYETTRIRKDGRPIVVRITRAPLYDADGRYSGSSAIIRDVTELKEMEARLLQQECLAAVGEMAAQVAHEIKNPLTGVRGACEILAEGFPEGHRRREIAIEVVRQMDRLNRTVEEFLQFARPKPMRPVPTNLHLLIDRVVAVLQEDPANRGVRVERRYDPRLRLLQVDPGQIEQVFFNVLLNAIQAMEGQGSVTISTEGEAGHASIRVADTGPGIPPGIEERIFRPFYTTRSKGTGLGLAIVRNIVDAHDGSVVASSGAAGGAEITITLPREG